LTTINSNHTSPKPLDWHAHVSHALSHSHKLKWTAPFLRPGAARRSGSNVQTSVAPEAIGDDDSDDEICEDSVRRAREEMVQVSVPEYWQVVEKSTTATMNLFLRLFLPTCRVLQKNKPIKWMTLQEKVIQPGALTKTQFDSRVEDLSRKLRTVNVKLAGLEPSTPTADEPDQTVTE
jgi:hypothetical protein